MAGGSVSDGEEKEPRFKKGESEKMLTCPVCGMEIDQNSAKRSEYKGRTYYLASDSCKARFEANPEKYLPMSNAAGHREHAHGHGCC